MALAIIEIHQATSPEALNTEWFVLENRGKLPFHTKNCAVFIQRKNKKKRELGVIDPGFSIAPGKKVRVVSGNPGRKAHGDMPAIENDEMTNYSLFLEEPMFTEAGLTISLALRSMTVVSGKVA